MLIMTMTRQLNESARPVTFAVVSEADVVKDVNPDLLPEGFQKQVEARMRDKLDTYRKEFQKDFPEYADGKFYIDRLELDIPDQR